MGNSVSVRAVKICTTNSLDILNDLGWIGLWYFLYTMLSIDPNTMKNPVITDVDTVSRKHLVNPCFTHGWFSVTLGGQYWKGTSILWFEKNEMMCLVRYNFKEKIPFQRLFLYMLIRNNTATHIFFFRYGFSLGVENPETVNKKIIKIKLSVEQSMMLCSALS